MNGLCRIAVRASCETVSVWPVYAYAVKLSEFRVKGLNGEDGDMGQLGVSQVEERCHFQATPQN